MISEIEIMAEEHDQIHELFTGSTTEFHDTLGGLAFLHRTDLQCATYPCSGKRRSPSSDHSEPYPKKPMHSHRSQERETNDNNPFPGFAEIPTPFPVIGSNPNLSSAWSPPELRRSISDPFQSPGMNGFSTGSVPLRRSASDPFNSPGAASESTKNDTSPASNSLPPRHSCAASRVPRQTRKTPNSLRLRRMKERMREMRQWWEEVIEEVVQEDVVRDEEDVKDCGTISKQDVSRAETEEVSVERIKEGFNVTFKCPCGRGYHIILYGKNCYYKLL